MRVFIAANIADEVKHHIEGFRQVLKKDYQRFNITWAGIDKYHLTLEFLGGLDNEKVQLAEQLLEQTANKFKDKHFILEFFEYSAFPSTRRPKALVVRARNKPSHNLGDLQKELHNQLLNKAFDLDNKIWQPHITLGRVRDRGAKINFAKHLFEPISSDINSFSVYSSDLQPTGAVYKQMATFHV